MKMIWEGLLPLSPSNNVIMADMRMRRNKCNGKYHTTIDDDFKDIA